MRNHADRFQPAHALQRIRHLLHAVLVALQNDHPCAGLGCVNQSLQVWHAAVDEKHAGG